MNKPKNRLKIFLLLIAILVSFFIAMISNPVLILILVTFIQIKIELIHATIVFIVSVVLLYIESALLVKFLKEME